MNQIFDGKKVLKNDDLKTGKFKCKPNEKMIFFRVDTSETPHIFKQSPTLNINKSAVPLTIFA